MDDDYYSFYPLYKHIYGYNNLTLYKSFFFIEPKNFILKNWLFFFIKFCRFNKINLLFIPDYSFYINFYKNILVSDIAVAALIPHTYISDYIDYPIFIYTFNVFIKTIYSSHILYIYSLSFNYSNLLNQYKYIKHFIKYISTF